MGVNLACQAKANFALAGLVSAAAEINTLVEVNSTREPLFCDLRMIGVPDAGQPALAHPLDLGQCIGLG